jgi:fermentation-respiration switch protein FrsA (DUF1100 family)
VRLPTATKDQVRREDGRAFHEALWTAHEAHRRVIVPVGDRSPQDAIIALHNSYAEFWRSRAYKLRAKVKGPTQIAVWVEARHSESLRG